MDTTAMREQHAVWVSLARLLGEGTPLLEALRLSTNETTDRNLKAALHRVMKDIQSGMTFGEALGKQSTVFSRAVRSIIRAGEVGGVLDVAAGEIARGIEEGSITLPGQEMPPWTEKVRYWRLLGILLSSGVPAAEALGLLSEETAAQGIRDATNSIRQRVIDGGTIADAMRAFPDVFEAEVCSAVEAGEENGDLDHQALRIAQALKDGRWEELGVKAAALEPSDEGRATAFLQRSILQAVEQKASDIHIEPTDDGRGRVRLRVDGVLREMEPLPEGLYGPLLGRIKVMSALDVAERRLPQDGRIMVTLEDTPVDVRVSVVPSILGERVVMRILDRSAALLGLSQVVSEDMLETVRGFCHLPNGLVISTGPTGCGKTTLMYAMLNEVDRKKNCVMSVEDPVEYRHDYVTQIQVRPQIGLTFMRAIVAIMRHDPDVIMVGELRDIETAESVVKCAITGHLVLTQLHANTAAGAVKRLLDMGIQPFMLNASLRAVIAQRLVRCLCPECRQPIDPPLSLCPPEAAAFINSLPRKAFHAPKGCGACKGTGYRGRCAVHEVLVMDDRIRAAVNRSPDLEGLHNAALLGGMRTLTMSGLELAARGVTSLEEIWRVVPSSISE